MSVNSSSAFNSSLDFDFSKYTVCNLIDIAFGVTRVVILLPISILVLYLGRQRWRSSASMSHSDVFAHHMAAAELVWCLGFAVYHCSSLADLPVMLSMGYWLKTLTLYGESVFHILTCVERYLAVVHPVTYLGLRKGKWVKIRNISTGCGWLLCIGWTSVLVFLVPSLIDTTFFLLLPCFLIVVSFCSISVFRVLIHPGPGELGGNRGRVNQSKLRASHTVMAISGALWFWFVGVLIVLVAKNSPLLSHYVQCGIITSYIWFNMPSSLVLPLMYLHRAGKLSCCSSKSG